MTCWTAGRNPGQPRRCTTSCAASAASRPRRSRADGSGNRLPVGKAAETVAEPSRGYDAGKKIKGRKRHIAVDMTGLLLTVLVTAAGVQDRDAAKPLLWNLRRAFPKVRLAWATGPRRKR